jgi:hypothetical protein
MNRKKSKWSGLPHHFASHIFLDRGPLTSILAVIVIFQPVRFVP